MKKKIIWCAETTLSVPFEDLVVSRSDGKEFKPIDLGWTPEQTRDAMMFGVVFVSLEKLIGYAEDTEHSNFQVEDTE